MISYRLIGISFKSPAPSLRPYISQPSSTCRLPPVQPLFDILVHIFMASSPLYYVLNIFYSTSFFLRFLTILAFIFSLLRPSALWIIHPLRPIFHLSLPFSPTSSYLSTLPRILHSFSCIPFIFLIPSLPLDLLFSTFSFPPIPLPYPRFYSPFFLPLWRLLPAPSLAPDCYSARAKNTDVSE